MRLRAWLLVLAVVAAGCSSEPAAPTAPPPEVELSFSQHRVDENSPRANLRVVNLDDERPLEVTAIGLDWPGYGDPFTEPHDSTIPPGQTIDLRLMLPPPKCDRVPERPAYGLVEAAGTRQRGRLVAAGQAFLESLWSRACNAAAVAAVADIRLGERWRVVGHGPDAAYVGSVVVDRSGSPDVGLEVVGLEGSILFALSAGGPRHLAPHADRLVVPVRLTPFRCDPHARGETTQAFLFRVDVALGDDQPRRITITGADPQWQARAMDYLDAACG